MSNGHNIPPFFKRRIDHHKFEKMMRKGISYMYYESQNVVEFKYKLVFATLENYLHDKYNIELTDVPSEDVVSFVEYMIDTYDPLLSQYYYNMRREGRGSVNEGTMDNTIQKIIDSSIKEIFDMCNDFDRLTFPNYMSFESCEYIDLISKITVKKITPIKKLSNIPMFDVEIDIDYNSALESVDFDEELTLITDHIKNKYKIFLVFTIMEQNNLHDRQMESIKPLIKKVLREETDEDKNYLWEIKYELEDKYIKLVNKFDQQWLKESEIVSVYYDEDREIFEVEIKSDRNWDLLWWIQFDKNMKMESVIKHEIKDWEYNIKDVEEIGGFEGYYGEFWSVIKLIYPFAQKYIIKKRKESLNENTEDRLKTFFFKMWDKQKEKQGVAFYDEDLLKKLGLYEPKDKRHRIWEYYVDYMGGKENQTNEFINYLENTIFNSSDSEEIQDRISFDFKFKLLNVDINNRRELKGSFYIVEGIWDDVDSGETYSIVTGQNEIDDMSTYFEMQYEIGEGISDFVTKIGRKFGLMLNFVDIREYKVN